MHECHKKSFDTFPRRLDQQFSPVFSHIEPKEIEANVDMGDVGFLWRNGGKVKKTTVDAEADGRQEPDLTEGKRKGMCWAQRLKRVFIGTAQASK